MSIAFPNQLVNAIQQNYLDRVIKDALSPYNLYRKNCPSELWAGGNGEIKIFNRAGNVPVDIDPVLPSADSKMTEYETEQWRVQAFQHAQTVPVSSPTSYISIVNAHAQTARQIAQNAAQTTDRVARNALYSAYLGGECQATALASSGSSLISVTALAGFSELVTASGQIKSVSIANPLSISFGGTASDNTVIGVTPDNAARPLGPGQIQLGAALDANVAARESIKAVNRSPRLRVGGGSTVDAITSSNVLTQNSILAAVQKLKRANVMPHEDGLYHCYVSPAGESQLLQDSSLRELFRGRGLDDDSVYKNATIGVAFNCRFISAAESPSSASTTNNVNTGTSAVIAPEIGAQVVNNSGVEIERAIVTGQEVMIECYQDQSQFVSAGGVNGVVKTGNWNMSYGGAELILDNIRYVIAAPIDNLQQVYRQSWSFVGGWAVGSDQLSPVSPARYKRAVIIEHAG